MKIISKLIILTLAFNVTQIGKAQMNITFADTLQSALENFAEENSMQGVSSAVVFPDGSTWSGVFGNHDDTPLTTNMLYDFGSNTKSAVSTTILLLEEAGELSIEDTLYTYLSPITNVPYGITLKQLMNHTSGIANYSAHPDYFDYMFDNPMEIQHPDSILSNYIGEPTFEAGTDWQYSNTNYTLLGRVIETVEGLPLNVVLNNRLFNPYVLNNTFLETYDIYPQVKTGFWDSPGVYGYSEDYLSLYSASWAAGGIVSTTDDFVSWCYQLCRGDILNEESMTKLITGTDLGTSIYGLGIISADYNGRPYLSHGGNTFQNSEMFYSIDSDFSVVVMDIDAGFSSETLDLELTLIDILEWGMQTVNTPEHNEQPIVSIYPNPSINSMTILLPNELKGQAVQYDVYNMLGEQVISTTNSNGYLILDKENLGSGQFLVKITNDNSFLINKTVIFQ